MKSLLLCLLVLVSSAGCVQSGSRETAVTAPVKAAQVYKNVDRFVDHEKGVVCYINRSTYFRQSDSIACVDYVD